MGEFSFGGEEVEVSSYIGFKLRCEGVKIVGGEDKQETLWGSGEIWLD